MVIKTLYANAANYNPNIYRNASDVKYIVVHYTANNGDNAKGNANYFANNKVGSSAHYFVDDKEVYLSVPENRIAYHCGANRYIHKSCRNTNSIGVELCSRIDSKGQYYFTKATGDNAINLVSDLCIKYGLNRNFILRHYDVTGKNCPAPFVENTTAWEYFLTNVQHKIEEGNKPMTYEHAINLLVEKEIIQSPDYWNNAIKVVNHLERLIINFAESLI